MAQQIASIGGDPQRALEAGTFAPGEIGDPTAAGNTCNVLDDAAGESGCRNYCVDAYYSGCIFSQNLIVLDATAEEIDAAVAGVEAGAGAGAVVEEPAVAEPAAEEPAVEEPAAVEGGQGKSFTST